jgi:hypothetical protein
MKYSASKEPPAIEQRNSRSLIDPQNHKWKVLIVGRPGVGKTSFLSTVPGIGIAACETGHGKGLLSVAATGIDYVEPETFADFRSICYNTFEPWLKRPAKGLDSLTHMTKSFIKDHCLANFPPRNQKEAMRRQAGVPVGFDYSDIADVTRALLGHLLNQNCHVLVTALEKAERDDNGLVTAIGPDLPGQLFLGAPAMFDTVLYLKVRKVLRDPKDPKSAYYQRYFITGNDGLHIAKDRNVAALDAEEVFDLSTGQGTFEYLYKKILAAHTNSLNQPRP